MSLGLTFSALWAGWLVSWVVAAVWAGRTTKRARLNEELLYQTLTIVGVVLMAMQARQRGPGALFWLPPGWVGWLLLVVAVAGLAFTWWARLHLGRLWSASVMRKSDHRVVDTGPYALVRHPIYTGLLVAIYATVLAFPGLYDALGAIVLTVGFVVKARLEERFLVQQFGADYAAYRGRMPMLVPFWPTGRG